MPDKVTIFDQEGRPSEVAPVDAREIVAGGNYFWENPLVKRADDEAATSAKAKAEADARAEKERAAVEAKARGGAEAKVKAGAGQPNTPANS